MRPSIVLALLVPSVLALAAAQDPCGADAPPGACEWATWARSKGPSPPPAADVQMRGEPTCLGASDVPASTKCTTQGREQCPRKPESLSATPVGVKMCSWKAQGVIWAFAEDAARNNPALLGSGLRLAFHDPGVWSPGVSELTGDDGSVFYETPPQVELRFPPTTIDDIWALINVGLTEVNEKAREKYEDLNLCAATAEDACRHQCERTCGFAPEKPFGCQCAADLSSVREEQFSAARSPRAASSSARTASSSRGSTEVAINATHSADVADIDDGELLLQLEAMMDAVADTDAGDEDEDAASFASGRTADSSSRTWWGGGSAKCPRYSSDIDFRCNRNQGPGQACYESCQASCQAQEFADAGPVSCRVSYADVVALVGAAVVGAAGGPDFLRNIQLGRCDRGAKAPGFPLLPPPIGFDVAAMKAAFPFFDSDLRLVALSGAHTLGRVNGVPTSDACTDINGVPAEAEALDPTPFRFDNKYFQGLVRAQCPATVSSISGCTSQFCSDGQVAPAPPSDVVSGGPDDGCKFYECDFGASACPAQCSADGCATFEASTGCECEFPCGLDERRTAEDCSASGSTCGAFFSDQMLYATDTTQKLVKIFAAFKPAFFWAYKVQHLQMAHIGCGISNTDGVV